MGGEHRSFQATAWTAILKARDENDLGLLFEAYWKPCYFFIRRRGHDVEDAKDLAQGFFTDFFERDAMAAVSRSKGRFRHFLLACLDHFLSNEYDRRKAKKRSARLLSINFEGTEEQLAQAREETPERLYRRQWAIQLIERALAALKEEMGSRFETLKEYIVAGRPGTLKEVAARIGLSEANVKVIIHRARRRYRTLLEAEVARTVDDPRDVEDELRELFDALS